MKVITILSLASNVWLLSRESLHVVLPLAVIVTDLHLSRVRRTPLILPQPMLLAVVLAVMVELRAGLALTRVAKTGVHVCGCCTRERVRRLCTLGEGLAVHDAVVVEGRDALGVVHEEVAIVLCRCSINGAVRACNGWYQLVA